MICRCSSVASVLLLPSAVQFGVFSRHSPIPETTETLPFFEGVSPGISRPRLNNCRFSTTALSPRASGGRFGQDLRGRKGFGNFHGVRLRSEIRHCGKIWPQYRFSEIAGTKEYIASALRNMEVDNIGKTSSHLGVSHFEDYLVGGRYCILLTGHASDYSQKLYGGYGQMFIKLLGDPDDTWDVYPVVDGQFPTDKELEQYDGFVVTGSSHDAHGSEDWIVKLCALLESLHEKKQKTLGICFGHQVLGRALGGKIGKSDVGWEIGLRNIQTTDALAKKPYGMGIPRIFRVLQSHQDQVQQLPPGGEVLGFSTNTGIEMFAVGDHTLGIQGHPEFTVDVVTDLIDTRLAIGVLKQADAADATSSLRAGQPDQEALRRLCKGFLKRRIIS